MTTEHIQRCDVCQQTFPLAGRRFEALHLEIRVMNGEFYTKRLDLEDLCSVQCLHRALTILVEGVSPRP